jgi:hypothetical protein
MKSKNDFTARPFDGQDVLVPTLPQEAAVLVGQCLSGLNKALALSYIDKSCHKYFFRLGLK